VYHPPLSITENWTGFGKKSYRMNQTITNHSGLPTFDGMPQNRLKGLLLWYLSSTTTGTETGTQALLLSHMLEDLSSMTAEECLDALEELSVEDLSKFSLLMEFGPEFADRPGYRLLLKCLQEKLSITSKH